MDYLQQEKDKIEKKIKEAQALLADPQMSSLAEEEIKELQKQLVVLDQSMIPPQEQAVEVGEDPYGNRNVILEVRGAAGGEEAKIWAQNLLRMYTRFALLKGWKVEIFDEYTAKILGKKVFATLKWEAGVHRVQRIPVTESSGRIHTSTATVAILPELGDIDFHLDPDDVEFEAYRSGGHGGQNVNKVSTAVRLKHTPTGLVVTSQSERYQHQNREIALQILRAKLWEIEEEKRLLEVSSDRKAQIGRGMRAEKIRTFNILQDRVTDHRLGKSWHNLETILEGKIEDIVQSVAIYFTDEETPISTAR